MSRVRRNDMIEDEAVGTDDEGNAVTFLYPEVESVSGSESPQEEETQYLENLSESEFTTPPRVKRMKALEEVQEEVSHPYRSWAFTLNFKGKSTEYAEHARDILMRDLQNQENKGRNASYMIMAVEGKSTPCVHIQGAITFKSPLRFSRVCKLLEWHGHKAHVEKAENTIASQNYCRKEGDWIEKGNFSYFWPNRAIPPYVYGNNAYEPLNDL